MRTSRYPLYTLKETPTDAEVVSHQLMLRAGMIRRVAAGIYTWLPLGLRVLAKVEAIVREEMNRAGAFEVFMPAVQPAELWQESGRWGEFGPELLRFVDRHERDFCLGPTHEEIITELVRSDLRSYRQLPLNLYQIQTKFRDEVRPRFGVMRSREFIMKDAYSFDLNEAGMRRSYEAMRVAYNRIFTRLGLDYRMVLADSGAIGGSRSQEFHVLAASGEDAIAFSESSDYAANIEMAEAAPPAGERPPPERALSEVATPGQHTIEALCQFLDVEPAATLKTLLVVGEQHPVVALCLRGDHELNPLKAQRLAEVAAPLSFADADAIRTATGASAGSVGPVGLDIPVIADHSALALADFVCGANQDDVHLRDVNWGRDLPEPSAADLRNAVDGDPSPDGQGALRIARGIEVGHIFQLGSKYSTAMNATVLDESGKAQTLMMGCYGIGVTRIVAAAIEQNNDARGIIWTPALAPFQLALLPLNMHKSERLRDAVEALYQELQDADIDVLLDDRGLRPGAMFADAELIGIPHRLVVSERGLDSDQIEYKGRLDQDNTFVARAQLIEFLRSRIEISPLE